MEIINILMYKTVLKENV